MEKRDASEVTWEDVAQAFRDRDGTDPTIEVAVGALRATKLRPSFVLDQIETRFPREEYREVRNSDD